MELLLSGCIDVVSYNILCTIYRGHSSFVKVIRIFIRMHSEIIGCLRTSQLQLLIYSPLALYLLFSVYDILNLVCKGEKTVFMERSCDTYMKGIRWTISTSFWTTPTLINMCCIHLSSFFSIFLTVYPCLSFKKFTGTSKYPFLALDVIEVGKNAYNTT
jgi:hypothetical protein